MMMSEFVERTGFQPTADEYDQIESAYYAFDGDKDAFCKAFVEQGGEMKIYKARANEIARLRSQMLEIEKEHKKEVADRDRRINELTAELDRELEWKPSDGAGTNMEQKRYEELAKYGKAMTDEEAKAFIADRVRLRSREDPHSARGQHLRGQQAPPPSQVWHLRPRARVRVHRLELRPL